MAKTRDRLYDTRDTMRPYVDRALHDDDVRDNLKEAFNAARDVYAELLGGRSLTATATRVATDKEIQENLKKTVDELRKATDRIQGKKDHGARNKMMLLTGIAAGILFNPMTGPQTRKWLMEKITGEGSDDYGYGTSSTDYGTSSTDFGTSSTDYGTSSTDDGKSSMDDQTSSTGADDGPGMSSERV